MRTGNSWWLLTLVAVLCVWFLDTLNVFLPLDRVLYDQGAWLQSRLREIPDQVVLVELPVVPLENEGEQLARTVAELQQLGAAFIGLAFQTDDLPSSVAESSNIVCGRYVIHRRGEPAWRPWLGAPPAHLGALYWESSRDGSFRWHTPTLTIRGQTVPTVEAVLAGLQHRAVPQLPFGIFFRGEPGSLPRVPIQDVLDGNLVPELVLGKTVLLGRATPLGSPGIVCPTSTASQPMSELELRGHSLNTLLVGSAVREVDPALRLGFLLVWTLMTAFWFQRCDLKLAWLLLPVGWLAAAMISLATLLTALTWLPPTALFVTSGFALAVITRERSQYATQTLSRLLLELSDKLRRRRWPVGFFSTAEPWPQVVSFIHQILNLNRLIILEHRRDAFHVREVHAFRCSLADIDERRRDYRRWPYAAAVDERCPIRIPESRPYLVPLDDVAEEQYLVPLLFGGDLFGFLAVGAAREQIAAMPDFENRLHNFSNQIAELLYRRQCAISNERKSRRWLKWLIEAPETSAYSQLVHAVHLLDRRLTRLERMFEKSDTASIIYDLFGRLLMFNEKMHQLLQREGISANELTTVDLVAKLTGKSLDESRNILRQVIVEAWPDTLPVVLDKQEGTFQLNVRPLQLEMPHGNSDDPAPFEVQGILCELVDRSSLIESFRMKEELTENLGNSLRDDLATVDLVASLLAQAEVTDEDRENYGQMIHNKIEGAVATLHECQRFLSDEEMHDWKDCFPVSACSSLHQAIASVKDAANRRGIRLPWTEPEIAVQAFAARKLLPRVFRTVLQLLLNDARDESEITIQVEEKLSDVEIRFSNLGYGIPAEQLDTSLPPQHSAMDELQRLREAIGWIEDWGGRLHISSTIGAGTQIKVLLRRFG